MWLVDKKYYGLVKKTMENGFLLLIPYQFIIARFPVSSLCLCLSKINEL